MLPGALEAVAKLKPQAFPGRISPTSGRPFYEHFRTILRTEAANQPQFLSFQLGLSKPDKEFFHVALQRWKSARGVVMIGDTYKNDIRPAIELGMKTIWVLHRPEKEKRRVCRRPERQSPAPRPHV